MKEKIVKNAKKIDVIISGGFHTTGISKLLEKVDDRVIFKTIPIDVNPRL